MLLLTSILLFGSRTVLAGTLDRSVDAHVRDTMSLRHIPGLAVAVIRNHRIERVAAYGNASIEFSVPVTPKTLFHVASVTKTVTAVAVMRWVEAGRLKLDDPIGKHLEGLPERWREVTVLQLLSHTSGIPDVFKEHSPEPIAPTAEDAIAILRDRPMDFAPGTQYRYNQTNFMLLGMLIQKLSGLAYEQFCQRQLFAPAGLNNPQFGDTQVIIENRGPIYTPFQFDAKGPLARGDLHVFRLDGPAMLYPANGLNISADDLAHWMLALMDSKVIKRASLERLWVPTRFNDGTSYEIPSSPFYPWRTEGAGWLLIPDAEHPAAGGSGGPYAAFALYPKDELAVAVLANTMESNPDSLVVDIARQYLAAPESGR
jgi:CubicO group peptidase (beta-lactamase class C family)